MRPTFPRALALAAALLAAAPSVGAQDRALGSVGGVGITDGFVVAVGPSARTAAAYVTIVNDSDEDDRLTGASGGPARRIELHAHVLENDVARMVVLPEGVPAPAGETVRLEPGGMHVMLMGLTEPLEPGDAVALTLDFEKAGPIAVTLPVQGPGAASGHGR